MWARAVPATEFRQQEPVEGAVPTENTEVRVAFDADNLYIGAELFDREPDGIKGFQRGRDVGLGSDDRFMWILDTFRDGRTAYFFEINPAGLLGDRLLRIGGGGLSKSWDGIWDVCVRQHAHGWTAEIRIPIAPSTSIRGATPGASTSSEPFGARARNCYGAATAGTRGCFCRPTPAC